VYIVWMYVAAAVKGPVGFIPVPVSNTEENKVHSDQYELIGGVSTVDRHRRRSSVGVTLRQRSADRDQRPVSYRDNRTGRPAECVELNSCGYINDTRDHVTSMYQGC